MRPCLQLGFACVVSAVLIAAFPRALAAETPDAGVPAGDNVDRGRPVCKHAGTKGEGWGWAAGGFIRWAKCKGITPVCRRADATHEVEGWYSKDTLIAPASCSPARSEGKAKRKDP